MLVASDSVSLDDRVIPRNVIKLLGTFPESRIFWNKERNIKMSSIKHCFQVVL
jgi:hypothetical protein